MKPSTNRTYYKSHYSMSQNQQLFAARSMRTEAFARQYVSRRNAFVEARRGERVMGHAEDDLVSYREDEVELDDEWLVLILKAREAGLTPDDVRQFFRFRQQAV